MKAWPLAALLVTSLASPAHAFLCTRANDAKGNATGPSLSWRNRSVAYSLNANATAQLDPNTVLATLEAAFLVWQDLRLDPNDTASCGSLPGTDMIFTQGPASDTNWVGYNFLDPNNNVNLLVFRDTFWNSDPNAVDIIALTTITYSALTGEILDADIEFNSYQYHFSTGTPGATDMDLLNTAVHEVGHFAGLAHCVANGSCGHQEVMEPSSNYAETQKRLLKCDDRAGMAFKYPAGAANQYCGSSSAACGNCAAPEAPTELPTITQLSNSTGRSSCQAVDATWLAAFAALFILRRRKASLRCGIVLLAALGTWACEGSQCNGQVLPSAADAPRITAMQFLESVPEDPWRVALAADFVDPDGDMGNGVVNFFTDPNTTPGLTYKMPPIFAASGGVPLTSTHGRIALLVRFQQETVSGSVLRLGTQFVDAQGNASNCYSLNLSFALGPGSLP